MKNQGFKRLAIQRRTFPRHLEPIRRWDETTNTNVTARSRCSLGLIYSMDTCWAFCEIVIAAENSSSFSNSLTNTIRKEPVSESYWTTIPHTSPRKPEHI